MNTTADRDVQATLAEAAENTQSWLDNNQADGGVCDFCAHLLDPATTTTWLSLPIVSEMSALDADTLGTGTLFEVLSSDWAACAVCDPIVEAGDPVALATHALDNRDEERVGPIHPETRAIIHADLVSLYERFYAGGAHRVPDPA